MPPRRTKRQRTAFEIPFVRFRREGDPPPKARKYMTSADIAAGALAHLLAPPEHLPPDQLEAITIGSTGVGPGPFWIEHARDGRSLAHQLHAGGEPVFAVLGLGGLREIQIEIRLVEAPTYPAAGLTALGEDDPDVPVYAAASLTELTDEEDSP